MIIEHLRVGDLETNCYLLSSEQEIAIIDPGGEPQKILNKISLLEGKPKYIINTHWHPDHILADKELKQKTDAKILIHKEEEDFINFTPDKFLEEGDKIQLGNDTLKVIHTPGHSKGSICLIGRDIIFSGDTVFKGGYGRTDLIGGSSKEMESSLKKLYQFTEPGIIIYPGHGEEFQIEE